MSERRFAVEEINNGFLVKVTVAGSDLFVGRWAFPDKATMLAWLSKYLSDEVAGGRK